MINDTNESKNSKDKTEEALIIRILAKNFLFKVIQEIIFSINTYKQDRIAVGNRGGGRENTDGIIVIIFLCSHCWGLFIVYCY